ncbi:hypothetical protein [Streptomyces sp. NPDC097640]|uniref:hypothetical protein n=1 Tax=Streptomyces sp. NPDC097640 TaxID=3157229 RepID=UPI0033284D3E
MPPKYDFAAADRLSQQLTELIKKIDWFLWLRDSQSNHLLGARHSDHWQGAKRDEFQDEFKHQKTAFTHLKDAAKRLQSQVHTATEAAHAAEKAEKNKN